MPVQRTARQAVTHFHLSVSAGSFERDPALCALLTPSNPGWNGTKSISFNAGSPLAPAGTIENPENKLLDPLCE